MKRRFNLFALYRWNLFAWLLILICGIAFSLIGEGRQWWKEFVQLKWRWI